MAEKLIAITGGIGSGKSLALDTLKRAGYQVASSDQITVELYQKRRVKLLIKKLFPTAVTGFFKPKINRKKIADIVFHDKAQLDALGKLVTPLVVKEIEKRARKVSGKFFAEVPVLFEYGYQDRFDEIIVITRPKKERIESVKTRSKLTEEQVLERINNQIDYENTDLSKYTILVNDGDQNALNEKILSLAKTI